MDLLKMLIYKFAGIDESGILGLAFSGSKYFVLTCFLHNDVNFTKKFRKFIGKLNHKKNKKKINTFHARRDDDNTKIKLIRFLEKFDYKFIALVCEKRLTGIGELDYPELLKKLIQHVETCTHVDNFFVSSPKLKQSFQNSILQVSEKIELAIPSATPELQIADLGAWAVFKHFEFGESLYFKLLENRTELIKIKI